MNANNELKGYLGGFDLTDVLQLISQQQKTGILTVKSTAGQVALYFKGGQIIGMNPGMPNQEFDLEQMLKKSGRLLASHLSNLRQEQIRRNISLEQMLVEHEVMNAEEVGRLNLLRIFEALACILRWKKGSYTFQPTSIVHETPYLPPQPSDFVLFEILRQMDESSVFEQNIPSVNTIYESVSTFASETDDNLFSEDFKDRLPLEEQTVLELVTKNNTVQDIIDKSLQGKYNVYRILNSFLESGIIAQKGEKAATLGRIPGSGQWDRIVTGILYISLISFIFLTIATFIPSAWLPVNIPGRNSHISPSKNVISKYFSQKNKAYRKAESLLRQ
jgi:hypothetical protein